MAVINEAGLTVKTSLEQGMCRRRQRPVQTVPSCRFPHPRGGRDAGRCRWQDLGHTGTWAVSRGEDIVHGGEC